jgi:chromosome segregation ATPase
MNKAELALELPADRARVVERGLTLYQQGQQEVERLTEELTEARAHIAELEAQVRSLESSRNMVESTAARHQAERDEAIAQRAIYEALFASFSAQLKAFNIPTKPIVKHVPELNAKTSAGSSLDALAAIANLVKSEPTMPTGPNIGDFKNAT